MAAPLQSRKQSVDMAKPALRVSKIRRDPPPPVKIVSAAEIRDRDARDIVIGIIAFALALFVVIMAISNAAGWSLSDYIVEVEETNRQPGSKHR